MLRTKVGEATFVSIVDGVKNIAVDLFLSTFNLMLVVSLELCDRPWEKFPPHYHFHQQNPSYVAPKLKTKFLEMVCFFKIPELLCISNSLLINTKTSRDR